jgi:ParB-like chromosome segregation protein Spo0J
MKVELWPIDRPRPYSRNPRVLSDAAIAKVMASIKEFGFRQPIVVDPKNVIIVGHKRLIAAKRLQMTHIPVTVADDLPPAKIQAYRLADNRTADEGEWDEDLLIDELSALSDLGLTLDCTGFDPAELDDLLGLNLDDADADDDATTDPDAAPVVARPGDQWHLGSHRLVVGDKPDRKIDLTIKRWMHYSGQQATLNGKTPFKDVQRDRAHEGPVGSGQPAPTRLAPRSRRPPRDPPRAA